MNDLDLRLNRALERHPKTHIPQDFAARLAAAVRPSPASESGHLTDPIYGHSADTDLLHSAAQRRNSLLPPTPVVPARVGRHALLATLAVLLLLMLALTPSTLRHSVTSETLLLSFAVEFALIITFTSLRTTFTR